MQIIVNYIKVFSESKSLRRVLSPEAAEFRLRKFYLHPCAGGNTVL